MRVHVFGNVLNNAVVLARELERAGVEARVFLPVDRLGIAGDAPEWEYGEAGVPAHLIEGLPAVRLLTPSNLSFVRRFVRGADLLHVFGVGPALLASHLGKLPPVVFHSYGGDLQWIPWNRRTVALRVYAFMQRRGIRRADAAIIQPYQWPFVRRLRYEGIVHDDVPFLADFENLTALPPDERVAAEYGSYRLVVYSPTRHAYDTHHDIGLYAKNNYVAIDGFSRFVKESGVAPSEACLVMVDKGPNVEDSRALIRREGIEPYVKLIPEHPKAVVYSFLRLPNVVVADQFPRVTLTIGGIAREALAFGCPLITRADIPATARQYHTDTVPLLYAETPEQIAAHLRAMLDDYARERHRQAARRWADVHLRDNRLLVERLLDIYAALLGGRA